MRKLESDIRRAKKKYEWAKHEFEEARDALQGLTDLEEDVHVDALGIRPNMTNVMYYGAYLSGVREVCNKILDEYFGGDNQNGLARKDDRLKFEAILKMALKSKLNAERWMGGVTGIMLEPVERDKEGKITRYEASFYVERTIRTKI